MGENGSRDVASCSDHSVVILVPLYKPELSSDEMVSLKHLNHFLGHVDRFFVAPEGLPINSQGFRIKRFDSGYFTDTSAYSRLLLSRKFYEAFEEYEYILVYQLDCLVFSSNLSHWLGMGFDYVGAPWFRSMADPAKGFSRVGNGGLSLRKVRSFLDVIDSKGSFGQMASHWRDIFSAPVSYVDGSPLVQGFLKRVRAFKDLSKGAGWYTSHYTLNEDRFWSDRARLFCPDFTVSPVKVGLSFSFERFPRYCFERNERRLPFGCHAWSRWDRSFWEPHLLK